MIYTDKVHIVADSLEELHEWAKSMGIGRWYFEGMRKCHPHYDIPRKKLNKVLASGITIVRSKELLLLSYKMLPPMKLFGDNYDAVVKGFAKLFDRAALFEHWGEFGGVKPNETVLRYRKANSGRFKVDPEK